MQVLDHLHAFVWQSLTANNCNTYFIEGPTPILIDPGHADAFGHVEKGLSSLGFSIDDIELIMCTHGHPDHFESIIHFKGKQSLIAMNRYDWDMIGAVIRKMPSFSGTDPDDLAPDFFLEEGDLSVNGYTFTIIHVPGHSPGSVAVYWPENHVLFTGDVIFKGGLGRTDLPGGNGRQLKQSILRLKELDVDYLMPGHGEMILDSNSVKQNFDVLERYGFAHLNG
ncbi:MAG: MBL fold metallo-hydrolase [Desulfobacterales bacterium]